MNTTFWKWCRDCGGEGEVAPQKKSARNPANMTGEIRELKTSVCATCQGTGMKAKPAITHER